MKNHAFRTFGLLVAALGCLTLAARGQTAVTETRAFLELPAEPGVFSAVGQNQSSTRAIDGDWLFLSTVVTWEGEPQTSGFILKVFRRSDDGWAYFQDIRSPDPEYSYWGSLDSFGARFVVKDQMVCVSAATYSDHGRILGGNGRVYVYALSMLLTEFSGPTNRLCGLSTSRSAPWLRRTGYPPTTRALFLSTVIGLSLAPWGNGPQAMTRRQ